MIFWFKCSFGSTCHKNGMCPVTHAGFPVPVISITASGPQAAGVCPHDTSVKQEIILFSGETEVHGDERLPQSHHGQSVVGWGWNSYWLHHGQGSPKVHRGPREVLSWREIIRAATIKMSGQDFFIRFQGWVKNLGPFCLSTCAAPSVPL